MFWALVASTEAGEQGIFMVEASVISSKVIIGGADGEPAMEHQVVEVKFRGWFDPIDCMGSTSALVPSG